MIIRPVGADMFHAVSHEANSPLFATLRTLLQTHVLLAVLSDIQLSFDEACKYANSSSLHTVLSDTQLHLYLFYTVR